MIDLHSHIIYGIDDGAQSLAESLEIGRMAVAGGTTVIAATPHGPGSTASRWYETETIVERAAEIEAVLRAEGVDLGVVAGTELAFAVGTAEALRRGLLLPYAGTRTVLFEPTYGFVPAFDAVVFGIQALGFRVLLAHPERVAVVQENPNLLLPLIERGVLMQVTAAALTGAQGGRIQRTAETLVSHHMIHVIASDTHRPTVRSPGLGPARDRAASLIGEQAANALVHTTPAAILADAAITLPPPQPVNASLLRRFW